MLMMFHEFKNLYRIEEALVMKGYKINKNLIKKNIRRIN